jgi:murein DD-endopeptidase MepM/ murein hydrolase activator NlpD
MALPALVFLIAVLLTPPTEAVARAGSWQRPVSGAVLRSFGIVPDRYAAGQHRGVDLEAALGTSVDAACGGRVTFAGRVPGGGRTVSVRCGRLIATYQQLATIGVRRGQRLLPGARLGTVGRSQDPRTSQPHVHLGARIAGSGRYVDPLTLLGDVRQPLPPLPPARAPAPRRVPLGPAPVRPVALPEPLRAPARAPAPAPAAPLAAAPWTVWVGLLLVGLGLPLGALVTRWRRRRGTPIPARLTA